MASITLQDYSTGTKQGWYSTTSTSNSSATLTFNFNTTEMNNFCSQINNITINSATLYMNCLKSGASRKKQFHMLLKNNNATQVDCGVGRYTEDYAYNRADVRFVFQPEEIQQWLSTTGTKTITSTDPEPKRYFGAGPWWSYNYIKVDNSYLVLDYTFNSSTATITNERMDVGDNYNIIINSNNENYTHDLILKIGSSSYTLLNKVSGGSKSIKIPLEIGNILFNKTSENAVFTLITYNENGEKFPNENNYNVIITIDNNSDHLPSFIGNISISFEKTIGGIEGVALAGKNNITLKYLAEGKTGANISKYVIKINGSNYETSNSEYVFIAPTKIGNCNIEIYAVDSRGYRTSETKTVSFYVSEYKDPFITVKSFYRANINGVRDEIDGTYAVLEYDINCSNNIKEALNSNNIVQNSTVVKGTQGGVSYENISSGVKFGGSFNISNSYSDFIFIITDTMGYSSSSISFELGSSAYLLHFRKNQNSIGLGCIAEDLNLTNYNGLITAAWPLHLKDKLIMDEKLGVESGGTGVDSYENLSTQLSPYLLSLESGGELKGIVTLSSSSRINNLNGISLLGYNETTGSTLGSYNNKTTICGTNILQQYDGTNTYNIATFGKNIICSETEPENPTEGMIWFKIS